LSKKKANPAIIGAFVTGALVLFVAGLIFFGSGMLFSERQTFVLFFSGSLKGLEKGSPVTFRGVPIGQVKKISILVDPDTGNFKMPVYISIDPKSIFSYTGTGGVSEVSVRKMTELLIKRGLKAQLQIQSLVTGKLLVDLDFHPEAPVHYVGLDKNHIEIPTVPSTVEEVVKRFEEIPINDLVEKLISAIDGLDKLVESGKIGATIDLLHENLVELKKNMNILMPRLVETLGNIKQTSSSTNRFMRHADRKLMEISKQISRLANSADSLTKSLKITSKNIEKMTSPGSYERYQLRKLLNESLQAARAIRELAQSIEAQPDLLIKGRSPEKGAKNNEKE